MKYALLGEIAESVRGALEIRKKTLSISELQKKIKNARLPQNFTQHLKNFKAPAVIAEVKFRSPSQGLLNTSQDPVAIADVYLSNGAAALSVLTEETHFSGSLKNLQAIREKFPRSFLLMKDFVIDEYQLLEARIFGADAVLLIVGLLSDEELKYLYNVTMSLGLTPLVEVHDQSEFQKALDLKAKIIGVNNRDLKTMKVSLSTSRSLSELAPQDILLVSESGIRCGSDISQLQASGYQAFLVGSSLMVQADPGKALSELISQVGKSGVSS